MPLRITSVFNYLGTVQVRRSSARRRVGKSHAAKTGTVHFGVELTADRRTGLQGCEDVADDVVAVGYFCRRRQTDASSM